MDEDRVQSPQLQDVTNWVSLICPHLRQTWYSSAFQETPIPHSSPPVRPPTALQNLSASAKSNFPVNESSQVVSVCLRSMLLDEIQ